MTVSLCGLRRCLCRARDLGYDRRAAGWSDRGQGRYVGIKRGSNPATCPVRALTAWIEAAGVTSGPIFRRVDRHGNILGPMTSQTVALVVKRAAAAAGLDPAKYSGHSLRAGFVTQGAINGASESNIMRSTGHKSHDTVRGYIRIANIFKDNVI